LLEGFRNGEEELATGGSTVALALVNLTKGIMVTGNLGDSHIIMEDYTGANGKATNIVGQWTAFRAAINHSGKC
jgi:hypothetical protein